MRTREKKLSDCGTSPGRAKELMALARQEQNMDLLCMAAKSSCMGLSDFLVKSLTEEVGYWSICIYSCDKGGFLWIPEKNACRFR